MKPEVRLDRWIGLVAAVVVMVFGTHCQSPTVESDPEPAPQEAVTEPEPQQGDSVVAEEPDPQQDEPVSESQQPDESHEAPRQPEETDDGPEADADDAETDGQRPKNLDELFGQCDGRIGEDLDPRCAAEAIVEVILDGASGEKVDRCEDTGDVLGLVGCTEDVHRQLFAQLPPEEQRDGALYLALAHVQQRAGRECAWESAEAMAMLVSRAVQRDEHLLEEVRDEFDDRLRGVPKYHEMLGQLDVDTWEGLEGFLVETRFYRTAERAGTSPRTSSLEFDEDGTYRAQLRLHQRPEGDEDFERVTGSWELVEAEPGEKPLISLDDSMFRITETELFTLEPADPDDSEAADFGTWDRRNFSGEVECITPPI